VSKYPLKNKKNKSTLGLDKFNEKGDNGLTIKTGERK